MSDNGHVRGVDHRMMTRRITTNPAGGIRFSVLGELFLNDGAENTGDAAPFTVAPSGLRAFDARAESEASSNHGGLRLVLMDSTRATTQGVNQQIGVGPAGSAAGISAPLGGGETGAEISLLVGSAPANLEIQASNTPSATWATQSALVTGYWT